MTPLDDARTATGAFAEALALDQLVSNKRTLRALDFVPKHESFVEEIDVLRRDWTAAIESDELRAAS
jgi:hypothetical protein